MEEPKDPFDLDYRIQEIERTGFADELRELQFVVVPTQPGKYSDINGFLWNLTPQNEWVDECGEKHHPKYNYLLVLAAPFTKVN